VSAVCTHPLDVTKVFVYISDRASNFLMSITIYSRMQTLGSERLSTLSVIRNSITLSGFRSLYAGLTASLLRQMSYSLVRLGAYEKFKAKLSRDSKLSPAHILLAACFAGGLGGLAGNPAGLSFLKIPPIMLLTDD
jgi:dicarboxylate transporter 10